ncbi:MAG: methyltransferase domain-containing protein [Planctomycetales bacterium]|nr:methyltransferase domain-containing protein [Planctomycetales bacterium]
METRPLPPDNAPPVANPFADAELAGRYEQWYSGAGRQSDLAEKQLLRNLLPTFGDVQTILEVGCGTGHFTRWFGELGYRATGLDSSPAMLAQARLLNGGEYRAGDALALPFEDRSFDVTALITTLEFVADPRQALAEAARVARRGLLLGVLNRHSLLTHAYRRSGKPLWQAAHFFSPGELRRLAQTTFGDRVSSIHWRTTLWPVSWLPDLPLPWGGFIGMAVTLREVSETT